MGLKKILIDSAEIEPIDEKTGKLHINILPLDENNDLEPAVSLGLYINDQLVKTLISDERGVAKDSFVLKLDEDPILQVKDINDEVRSKIRVLLKSMDVEEGKVGETLKILENKEGELLSIYNKINNTDFENKKRLKEIDNEIQDFTKQKKQLLEKTEDYRSLDMEVRDLDLKIESFGNRIEVIDKCVVLWRECKNLRDMASDDQGFHRSRRKANAAEQKGVNLRNKEQEIRGKVQEYKNTHYILESDVLYSNDFDKKADLQKEAIRKNMSLCGEKLSLVKEKQAEYLLSNVESKISNLEKTIDSLSEDKKFLNEKFIKEISKLKQSYKDLESIILEIKKGS